jgi:hypothetical protein
MWWGQTGERKFGPALSWILFFVYTILERLGILKGTNGLLFWRAEYKTFTTFIRNAKSKTVVSGFMGLLASGSAWHWGHVQLNSRVVTIETITPGRRQYATNMYCVSMTPTPILRNLFENNLLAIASEQENCFEKKLGESIV